MARWRWNWVTPSEGKSRSSFRWGIVSVNICIWFWMDSFKAVIPMTSHISPVLSGLAGAWKHSYIAGYVIYWRLYPLSRWSSLRTASCYSRSKTRSTCSSSTLLPLPPWVGAGEEGEGASIGTHQSSNLLHFSSDQWLQVKDIQRTCMQNKLSKKARDFAPVCWVPFRVLPIWTSKSEVLQTPSTI